MPEIPRQAPTYEPYRPAVPSTGAAIGEAVAGVAVGLAKEADQRARTSAQLAVDDALSTYNHEVATLEMELRADPDFTTADQRYKEKAEALLSELANKLPGGTYGEIAKSHFQRQAGGIYESGRSGVYQDARRKEVSSYNATIAEVLRKDSVAYSRSANPVMRDQIVAHALDTIDDAWWIPAEERQKMQSEYQKGLELADITEISSSMKLAQNVGDLKASVSDLDAALSEAEFIPADDLAKLRAGFANDVETRVDYLETQGRRAKREASEDAYKGWLQEINPENPNTPLPNPSEIARDPSLKPEAASRLINMVNQKAKGETFKDNPHVAVDLFQRIQDPVRPDRIRTPSDLLPYVGPGGITPATYRTMEDDLRERDDPEKNPERKRLDKAFNDWILTVPKQRIMGKSMFGGLLGGQDSPDRYWNFKTQAKEQWDKAIQAGEDPMELIDPRSQKYLGNRLYLFEPDTSPEGMRRAVERFRSAGSKPTTIPPATLTPAEKESSEFNILKEQGLIE